MPAEACDVVHIVNQMRPGGIETMVLDLVRHSSLRSRIFSLEGSQQRLVSGWPGLAVVADRLEGFERSPGLVPQLTLRLARRLRQLAPRTVFLHRISPLLYGGLAARMAGVANVVHVEHDVWHYDDPRRRALLKWSARMARPQHFAVSEAVAAVVREIVPGAAVKVVPAGVDLGRFKNGNSAEARALLGLPAGTRVVGSAGRLETVKGHRVLVEAMRDVPDSIVAVVAGQGSELGNLRQQAARLGVEDRVRFLGHRDDLERIFPAFDLFCLPSLGEGLPRVLMEVQAAGVPVVASDVGSVRQAVCPGTGRLVPADDPRALADAITAVMATPQPRDACRSFAEANFSLARMLADYDAVTTQPRLAA